MNDDMSFDAFDPLHDARPFAVLDRHPDGRSIALQAYAAAAHGPRAAVWDTTSGQVIWEPPETSALCWFAQGRRVLLVRASYQRDPHHPPRIATPLQREVTYSIERQTWPQHEPLRRCVIKPPEGWIDRVVVSPQEDVAAVRWLEQDAAGFLLIGLGPDEDRPWPHAGYRTAPDNLVRGPVFSPDGRYLVLTCGRSFWWSPNSSDPLQPAVGGRYTLGHIAIYDIAENSVRGIPVEDKVRPGWLPPYPQDMAYELLGTPRFADDKAFSVTLPTGCVRHVVVE